MFCFLACIYMLFTTLWKENGYCIEILPENMVATCEKQVAVVRFTICVFSCRLMLGAECEISSNRLLDRKDRDRNPLQR